MPSLAPPVRLPGFSETSSGSKAGEKPDAADG